MTQIPVPERTYQLPQKQTTTPGLQYYNPLTNAHCYENEVAAHYVQDNPPINNTVALDIETRGTDKFYIRCVTAAWDEYPGHTVNLFLDPRHPGQYNAIKTIIDAAKTLVFHNSVFDIPGLYQSRLMELHHIDKVWDTIILARMLETHKQAGRDLDTLARKHANFPEITTKIEESFAIMGHKPYKDAETQEKHSSKDMGFRSTTPETPIYRAGAMADTVATLRLLGPLYQIVFETQMDYALRLPTPGFTGDQAGRIHYIMQREQVSNQVMLKRSAIGIAANMEYAEKFTQEFKDTLANKEQQLKDAGVDPDPGKLSQNLGEYLIRKGKVNEETWPRTAGGKLSFTKQALAPFTNDPIVEMALSIKEDTKIINQYLTKIMAMVSVTGRIHPEAGILGAHATGRMSYKNPELQQFPAEARPILQADPGREWTSIDWSSIEPVVLTNVAHDFAYLVDFDKGGDLYIPSAKAAGLIPKELSEEEAATHPGRKKAKVIVLANMYGQGAGLLAKNLKVSVDEAKVIKQQYNEAMMPTVQFLRNVADFASEHGFIRTIDGRALTVDENKFDPERPWDTSKYTGYRAMNYIVQGTAYSILSETLNEIHKRGLDEAVIMAIHDELVVDSEAVDEVQKIMVTAPEWLNDAAGREVILRSDSNDMGNHWMYV